jgi:hypothetical protein
LSEKAQDLLRVSFPAARPETSAAAAGHDKAVPMIWHRC